MNRKFKILVVNLYNSIYVIVFLQLGQRKVRKSAAILSGDCFVNDREKGGGGSSAMHAVRYFL